MDSIVSNAKYRLPEYEKIFLETIKLRFNHTYNVNLLRDLAIQSVADDFANGVHFSLTALMRGRKKVTSEFEDVPIERSLARQSRPTPPLRGLRSFLAFAAPFFVQ